MGNLLNAVGIFSSFVSLSLFIYEYFTTDDQKKNHKQKISHFLRWIQSIRSLELAQNDARLILLWLNRIYGEISEYRFLARDFWGRRPVCVSILITTIYLGETSIFLIYLGFSIGICMFLCLILANAFLDLISVNISRILFFKISESCHLRDILKLIFIDFGIAILLYICGILVLNSIVTFIDYIEYPLFYSDWTFYDFIDEVYDLSTFWKEGYFGEELFLGFMFFTTVIPTIFHLLISASFFVGKVFAQPLRLCIEKIIEYMLRLPKGVTALFALFGAVIIYVLFWIIDKLLESLGGLILFTICVFGILVYILKKIRYGDYKNNRK